MNSRLVLNESECCSQAEQVLGACILLVLNPSFDLQNMELKGTHKATVYFTDYFFKYLGFAFDGLLTIKSKTSTSRLPLAYVRSPASDSPFLFYFELL